MSTDIFLSYASEDTSKAVELARVLQSDGWSVWWDRNISPGQDFEIEIDMALSQARAVVVLWSVFSVSSNWVRNEAREAKEANKLIPVMLDEARIPLSYRSLNTIDLRQWPDKQSLLEISMFKSAVSRVLHNGVSGQMLKKPGTTEEMTLSVRVASRVADMVAGRKSNDAQLAAQDSCQVIEYCITDICLDLLNTSPDTVESKIDAYIMQLANVLRAPLVICSQVNFLRMSVSAMRSMSYSKVSAEQEKAILAYVNEYCSPSDEHNLRLSPGKWPEGKMLCLPLSHYTEGREFAWFISEAPIAEWTLRTIHQKLRRQHIDLDQVYDFVALRILVNSDPRLLRRPGRAAQPVAPRSRPHQGLHRHAAAQRLPVAAHLGHRRRGPALRGPDPHPGDAPGGGGGHRRPLEVQGGQERARQGRPGLRLAAAAPGVAAGGEGPPRVPELPEARPLPGGGLLLHPGRGGEDAAPGRLSRGLRLRRAHRGRPSVRGRAGQRQDGAAALQAEERRHRRDPHRGRPQSRAATGSPWPSPTRPGPRSATT